MLKLTSLLISSENPQQLTAFYVDILGKQPVMMQNDYATLDTGACYMTIGPHDQLSGQNPSPQRILLNFETSDVQREFDRIKALGKATVVKEPYRVDPDKNVYIATLADPDGNYFQLVTPYEEMGG